jgi:hypothetical protein
MKLNRCKACMYNISGSDLRFEFGPNANARARSRSEFQIPGKNFFFRVPRTSVGVV